MTWDHIIKNGKIVTSNETYVGNIYIKDGKIARISNEEVTETAKEVTDARGLHILPGLMDTHIHSREGGAAYKEDFFHSTKAAAAGGITTVFEMPNCNPPISNKENFEKQVANFKSKAHVNFGVYGVSIGDENLGNLAELDCLGVVGYKYFWGYAIDRETFTLIYNYEEGMENVIPPCDDGEVYAIFEEIAKTGKMITIHAENSAIINRLTEKIKSTGKTDYDTVLKSRPNIVESTTIQTGIELAKETGARLHVLHISTAEGVELIRQAQAEGYPITGETCPHYLFLTNEDFKRVGTTMKVYPLIKYQEDQDALWEGIKDGTISIVCSDHAPHSPADKDTDLWNCPSGMCGVETLAPLMIHAASEGRITLNQVAALLSENPAKQFGFYPQKGTIQVGTDADLTLVDMKKGKTIEVEKLHSKSKLTAFDGFKLLASPVGTIVNGKTIMRDGVVGDFLAGEFVKPIKNQ